jgi:hypothetical protein
MGKSGGLAERFESILYTVAHDEQPAATMTRYWIGVASSDYV